MADSVPCAPHKNRGIVMRLLRLTRLSRIDWIALALSIIVLLIIAAVGTYRNQHCHGELVTGRIGPDYCRHVTE